MKIVIDTREQLPLHFRRSKNLEGTVRGTLSTGDYSILGWEDKIAIERKSPADLFGTLGTDNKRFKREIERAITRLDYFAIIVECSQTVILNKSFDGAHNIKKMRGDVVIKILSTLQVKYGIPVIFCNGRAEASSIIRHLFYAYLRMQEKKRGGYLPFVKRLRRKWKIK